MKTAHMIMKLIDTSLLAQYSLIKLPTFTNVNIALKSPYVCAICNQNNKDRKKSFPRRSFLSVMEGFSGHCDRL